MLFEYAPISLMEQDFSAIRTTLDQLRQQGVRDLAAHLDDHPTLVDTCMSLIKVGKVNRQTLAMYGVQSRDELLANVHQLFRDEMRVHFHDELLALWEGRATWSGEGVNYNLAGQPIDILLSWRILPGAEQTWGQVLVAIEDITPRKLAERNLIASENRLRGLFEDSPISLWEEDYSEIKTFFDQLRAEGIEDLGEYLDQHPEMIIRCMGMIHVRDVNRRTLTLFGAESKQVLLGNLAQVFRDEMQVHFRDELLYLWSGALSYEAEGINYTLQGEPLYVHVHLSVYPGYEETFERVLVALEDITARRKAEEYLRYLGTHDALTGLHNRAFFQEEIKRLSDGRYYPVSVLIADLDDLKVVNDTSGHVAGDNYIRRAAEVLKASFRPEDVLARIGGDEFAALIPHTNAQAAREIVEGIRTLVRLNNRYYGAPLLSISLGVHTGDRGEDLERVMNKADDDMYRAKREYHRQAAKKSKGQ